MKPLWMVGTALLFLPNLLCDAAEQAAGSYPVATVWSCQPRA